MAPTIWREKTQAVLKQGLLTLAQPTFTLEAVGGLNRFKLWTRGLGHLIHHAEAALAWGLKPQDLPKGCLLIGIPGTGKSMLAEAIAGQWGVPLVRLSVEDFLDSLVGNSERRFAAALRTAEALGRCVMHVDEAEKLFDTRNVSNDVMKHILGMLLTWLQERMRHAIGVPPMVFVVMTVNKVNGLPPELYRPGRLDRTWFFDVGGAEEREAVLRLHLEARRQTLGDEVIQPLTAETKGWTPAELERMVVTACTAAFTAERSLTADDIFLARSDIKPFSETHKEQLEEIRGFAAQWATPANDGDSGDPRTRQPSGRSFA
jgi:SpoVK/Ycf46/Vps4 family AAA+-type ATPase